MKKAISLVIGCFLCSGMSTINAQSFTIPLYNASFTECEQNLYDLERLPISKEGWVDKFLKEDQNYTGCAVSEHRTHEGALIEYRVYEIQEGFPVTSIYYFPNGSISREFNFNEGRKHGLHVMYHSNGIKYIEEHYENGKMHGTIKRWTKQGVLARDAYYEHGIRVFDKVYIEEDC